MERNGDSAGGCHPDDPSPSALTTSETSTECARAESTSSPSSTSSLTALQTLHQSSLPSFPSSAQQQQQQQQLPKNAVELIAWAITECVSTTPTLVQIASRIHKHVAAYRDQDLGIVMRMVQHHLDSNNPEFFLPVLMAPPGVSGRPPAMNKWALNHQTVHVRKDGSLSRRRAHRPSSSSSSSSSYVSKHVTSSSPYLPVPPQAGPSPKYLLQCLQQSEGVQHGPGTNQLQVYSGTPPPVSSYLPAASDPCSSGSSTTAGGAVYSYSSALGSHPYPSAATPVLSTPGTQQQLSRASAYGSSQGPVAYRGGPGYSATAAGPGPYGPLISPAYSSVLGPLGAAYGVTSASGFGLGLHPALYGGVSSGGAGYDVSGAYSLTPGTTFDLSYATGPATGATAAGLTGSGVSYQCSL